MIKLALGVTASLTAMTTRARAPSGHGKRRPLLLTKQTQRRPPTIAAAGGGGVPRCRDATMLGPPEGVAKQRDVLRRRDDIVSAVPDGAASWVESLCSAGSTCVWDVLRHCISMAVRAARPLAEHGRCDAAGSAATCWTPAMARGTMVDAMW